MKSSTHILSVSIPHGLSKAVDRLAEETAQNRSELIRHALREYIADMEEDRQRFIKAYRASRKERTYSLKEVRKQLGG
jgi:metal-responsive CopG/Arc/MetJ family transcriptional regulator